MAGAKGGKNTASSPGPGAKGRGPRRRTLLNLGIPFVPVDDFVTQAEDAVALGYDVLEKVVNEIKAGYDDAVDYNKERQKAEKAGSPPPPIRWQDVVARVQNLNAITLDAMERGNRIFLDSVAAGIRASNDVAATLTDAGVATDKRGPRLAGPVFTDLCTITVEAGQSRASGRWVIDHPGLTRLRIHAEATKLQQLQKEDERGKTVPQKLSAALHVAFEPKSLSQSETRSVLTIELGEIRSTQAPGTYLGQVIASNFELLIANVAVIVQARAETSQAYQAGA